MKKYAKCVHCGEKGHIRPTSPKYLVQIESGEIQCPVRATPAPARGKPANPRYKVKDRRARALLSVFQAFYRDDSDNDDSKDNGAGSEDQDEKAEENENSDDDDDIHGFLSMIGSSLKD